MINPVRCRSGPPASPSRAGIVRIEQLVQRLFCCTTQLLGIVEGILSRGFLLTNFHGWCRCWGWAECVRTPPAALPSNRIGWRLRRRNCFAIERIRMTVRDHSDDARTLRHIPRSAAEYVLRHLLNIADVFADGRHSHPFCRKRF